MDSDDEDSQARAADTIVCTTPAVSSHVPGSGTDDESDLGTVRGV